VITEGLVVTTESTAATDPGRIFVDAAAYADFDRWHEIATEIRRSTPIRRVEVPGYQPFWAVTRLADVMEVERNPEVFTNEPASVLTPNRLRRDLDPDVPPSPVKTLINMDGDEHKAHRGLVNEWFKPGSVRRLNDTVEGLARRYVDLMASKAPECDFAQEVAVHYPLHVILSILGLPESDYPRMLQLTQELFGAEDPEFQRDESTTQLDVIMDFFAYFSGITAQRRAEPGDDLASVFATATLDGEPLNDFSTFGFYLIIATAGHDTTSNAVAGGLLALLQHPAELAKLQADPTLVEAATDELIRWVSPVKHFMRTAQVDYELAGTKIAKGDWVLLSYQSANRDETVFDDPFRFDVTRPDASKHLAFGFGRHYCLGAHLAKLEVKALFKELVPRLESIELAGTPSLMHSTLVSGPTHLPVRYRFKS
jgi:cytochrome P450